MFDYILITYYNIYMNALDKYIDLLTPAMIREGMARTEDARVCLACGKRFEDGEVYPDGRRYFTAEAASTRHLKTEHPDYMLMLLSLDKTVSGLTDAQKEILKGIYQGLSDAQIAQHTPEKGVSAVRNMKFHLRRKAREAKVFLGIMGILEDIHMDHEEYITFEADLPINDDRTIITRKEEREILGKYLTNDRRLSRWPRKEKEKLVLLNHMVRSFEPGNEYTEAEVNDILSGFLQDYVTLRRYLIEYRFLSRKADGSRYWR